VDFQHDCIIVPPGALRTNVGKPYTVYGPWFKKWVATVDQEEKFLRPSDDPEPNEKSVYEDEVLGKIFEEKIPTEVEGFECKDAEKMREMWPSGREGGQAALDRFLEGKRGKDDDGGASGTKKTLNKPENPFQASKSTSNKAPAVEYPEGRNRPDVDGTSRLSPYLAAGVISPREAVNMAKSLNQGSISRGGKENGFSNWISEVAWRDFYAHVLAAFPRVVMGRAYNLSMESVVWVRRRSGESMERG